MEPEFIVIYDAIANSELDCCDWDPEVQKELVSEILLALYRAGYKLEK